MIIDFRFQKWTNTSSTNVYRMLLKLQNYKFLEFLLFSLFNKYYDININLLYFVNKGPNKIADVYDSIIFCLL